MRALLTFNGQKMHVKDLRKVYLDKYVLYVCDGKITIMPLVDIYGKHVVLCIM